MGWATGCEIAVKISIQKLQKLSMRYLIIWPQTTGALMTLKAAFIGLMWN